MVSNLVSRSSLLLLLRSFLISGCGMLRGGGIALVIDFTDKRGQRLSILVKGFTMER